MKRYRIRVVYDEVLYVDANDPGDALEAVRDAVHALADGDDFAPEPERPLETTWYPMDDTEVIYEGAADVKVYRR